MSTYSQVLSLIRVNAPISQSDIRIATGLSASAVSGTVKRAMALGLIQEVGQQQKSMGRPHSMLNLNREYGYAIGVQLNSNHNQIVITNLKGEIVLGEEICLNSFSPNDVVSAIATFVQRISLERIFSGRIVGIGIGLSGIVDAKAGVCLDSTTLLGWHDVPIAQLVAQRTQLPTSIENDANALALAELLFGLARPRESFVMVTLGNGIGAGIIIDQALYRGRNGLAGEIGHTRVTFEPGFSCHCGKEGCLEAVVSREPLERRIAVALGKDGVAVAGDQLKTVLKTAIATGNLACLEIIHKAGTLLGATLANLATTFDPDAVYLAFEPSLEIPELIHAAQEGFRANLLPVSRSKPELRILIDSGTMWARGASSIAIERFFETTALELAALAPTLEGSQIQPQIQPQLQL